jgi:pseudaminic acid biosynthesis-associated methylase
MHNEQVTFWKGTFGDDYIERNCDSIDKSYMGDFGMTRSEINERYLSKIPKDARILEVGCNIGLQLNLLQKQGFTNLWGLEINEKALAIVRKNTRLSIVEATAQDIPFKDGFFDLVFTSRVLIHIPPTDLPKVFDEMYRVTRSYIWCLEYYAPQLEDILYRGNKGMLWRNDFQGVVQKRHPDLSVVRQEYLKYLTDENVDTVFLLKKGGKTVSRPIHNI